MYNLTLTSTTASTVLLSLYYDLYVFTNINQNCGTLIWMKSYDIYFSCLSVLSLTSLSPSALYGCILSISITEWYFCYVMAHYMNMPQFNVTEHLVLWGLYKWADMTIFYLFNANVDSFLLHTGLEVELGECQLCKCADLVIYYQRIF